MSKIVFARIVIAAVLLSLCGLPTLSGAESQQAEPVVIGDVSSFTAFANYTAPYKKGVDMAVDEINANGGILGRPLQLERRDDGGKPEDAIKWMVQLSFDKRISAVTGLMYSHIALAASQVCKQKEIPCIAIYGMTDKLLNEEWHPWIFRLARSTFVMMRAITAEAAAMPMKRLVIAAPQYEYGISVTDEFKREIKRLRPDVEIVGERFSPLNRLDAGATITALIYHKPDAVFSAHAGSDQARFIRDGNARKLFEGRSVIMPRTAMNQDVGEMLKEVPSGVISLCYSPSQITIPQHAMFRKNYLTRYSAEPDETVILGYSSIYAIKAAIEKAGSTDRAAVRDALEGLTWGTPLGDVTFRKFDHQSNIPFFYGKTTGDGSGLPLCNDMKQADPWAYWPRPDDELPEVLKDRKTAMKE